MIVTNKNFKTFYNDIKLHLPNAEYYSIDLEMTGIRVNEPELLTDTPIERFQKLRHPANKYKIIQMGLCLFTRTSENELEARPYNIYLFPRERYGFSPQLALDASAMDFNCKFKMDWNTWIYEGVTYMPMKDARRKREELIKILEQETKIDDKNTIKLERDSDVDKSARFKEDLEMWLQSDSTDPFIVTESSKFFRKFLYETLRKDYPELVCKTVQPNPASMEKEIHIFKVQDDNEKKSFMVKKREQMEDGLLENVGFTSVIELLAESRKKLVGHNCFLDLLYVYSHFVENVPENYMEFKSKLSQMFPEVIDTKFIANHTKFQLKTAGSTALGNLLNVCLTKQDPDFSQINIKLAEGYEGYNLEDSNSLRLHEAGYDAYVTGFVYAKMFYNLDQQEQEKVLNSVNLMKSLHYFKHGLLSHEEMMFKDYAVHFARIGKENFKAEMEKIRSHFESFSFKQALKILHINNTKFSGVMLNFESEGHGQKSLFSDRLSDLKGTGVELLTYKEYLDLGIEEPTNNLNNKQNGTMEIETSKN